MLLLMFVCRFVCPLYFDEIFGGVNSGPTTNRLDFGAAVVRNGVSSSQT